MSRILIIEDDEAIADLEKDYLSLNGHEVEIKSDGEEGLKKALSEDFDLFIIDIMLPGMDGFEVLRQIRESKETPILLVSARKDDIDKIKGLGLGADDYITKPFSPSELVARVKSHLARYDRIILKGLKEAGPDTVQIRGLKIDKNNKRVYANGDEIKLRAKEYELLLYMANHPNTVFTKEELFLAIWNTDIGDIKTVTVHINRLREKLELNPSKPQYIETIWGVGYRFKV